VFLTRCKRRNLEFRIGALEQVQFAVKLLTEVHELGVRDGQSTEIRKPLEAQNNGNHES
jgi:hypothetical protein